MAKPGKHDLLVYAGDDFTEALTFGDGEDPIDLTGYAFRAQHRPSTSSATATDIECTITDADAGEVIISLTAEQTATIKNGVWDLEMEAPGGAVRTVLAGKVKVTQGVTHG